MIWRIGVLVLIVLVWAGRSVGQAEPLPDAFAVRTVHNNNEWENDNNLIDTLFQNFNGNENSDGGHKKKESIGPLPAPVSAPAMLASATDTQVRARAGRETTVFLTADHVVLRVGTGLPEDLEIGIRIVTASDGSPPPGLVIGDLLFRVTARDPGGADLAQLPIEANLSARYTDAQLGSRDEGKLVLSWRDPADGQWKPAPKPAADPRNNYISATIQSLGLYAVYLAS
jgi:hypothetical protein